MSLSEAAKVVISERMWRRSPSIPKIRSSMNCRFKLLEGGAGVYIIPSFAERVVRSEQPQQGLS
jgi:hypothetical protein